MKNPFKLFDRSKKEAPEPHPPAVSEPETPVEIPAPAEPPTPSVPEDAFEEWLRTRIGGGVERRERNDIFEAYGVFGADGEKLVYRLYHRYPEHERDFGLSYSRELTLEEFNSRLLLELDKASITLCGYSECIKKAEALSGLSAPVPDGIPNELTVPESEILQSFCDSIDTLKDKNCSFNNGVFRCEGTSVAGSEELNIRFRRLLERDAYYSPPSGVSRIKTESYDIDDIWIMGICNRLRESGAKLIINKLSSEWSLNSGTVFLILAENMSGIDGKLLIAVAEPADILRFGFYSLDFNSK